MFARLRSSSLLAAALAVGAATPSLAQKTRQQPQSVDDTTTLQKIHFTHADCGPKGGECRVSYSLALEDGETFAIIVKGAQPDLFRYDIAAFKAAEENKARIAGEATTEVFFQQHDGQFGGYVMSISLREGKTSDTPPATLLISVRTKEWRLAFAGGFPISSLHDRTFSLQDTTVGGATRYLVRREKDHEDKVSLATATFVHLRHSTNGLLGVPWLGLSFGLGVGSNTTYYVGPSGFFGDAGALTVGAVFGSHADLPAGVTEGAVTANANALTTLARRNAAGIFAGFSYSFIGGGDADLKKPFKPAP